MRGLSFFRTWAVLSWYVAKMLLQAFKIWIFHRDFSFFITWAVLSQVLQIYQISKNSSTITYILIKLIIINRKNFIIHSSQIHPGTRTACASHRKKNIFFERFPLESTWTTKWFLLRIDEMLVLWGAQWTPTILRDPWSR